MSIVNDDIFTIIRAAIAIALNAYHYATAKWLEARRRDLLPVPYFHLGFLPCIMSSNTLIAYNKKALHDLLFQATWGVIATLGQDRLKGQMGMIAIFAYLGSNTGLPSSSATVLSQAVRCKRMVVGNRARKAFYSPLK